MGGTDGLPSQADVASRALVFWASCLTSVGVTSFIGHCLAHCWYMFPCFPLSLMSSLREEVSWPQESDNIQEAQGSVIILSHVSSFPLSPASTFCHKHRSLPWTHVCQMLLPLLARFFLPCLLPVLLKQVVNSSGLHFLTCYLVLQCCMFWFLLLREGPPPSPWLNPVCSPSAPARSHGDIWQCCPQGHLVIRSCFGFRHSGGFSFSCFTGFLTTC